jgi:hypothetical protein
MYTQLLGRDVSVAVAPAALRSSGAAVFGTYRRVSDDSLIVVKADLALMASIGGVLVGLPEDVVQARVKQGTLDEVLQDAIHEVLNITSTPLSEDGRVVFKRLDLAYSGVSQNAKDVMVNNTPDANLVLTVKGYTGGRLSIWLSH